MRNFYTPQDLRTQLRPGTFVYPYFADFSSKLGRVWSGQRIKSNSLILPYLTNLFVYEERGLNHLVQNQAVDTRQFKYAKVYYVSFDRFFSSTKRIGISVTFPAPLGIYLGEYTQILNHGQLADNHYYARVLTTNGNIIWI